MTKKQAVSTTPTMLPPALLQQLRRAANRDEIGQPEDCPQEYSSIMDLYDDGSRDGEREMAITVLEACGIPLEE